VKWPRMPVRAMRNHPIPILVGDNGSFETSELLTA
jgi:hypothetical protein